MEEQQFCKADIAIYRIISDIFNSNTYIVEYQNDILIIDPGENKKKEALHWFKKNKKKPNYCLITHEHFDHNIGYKKLINIFGEVKTFCSLETKEALRNSKKNLSFFYNIPTENEVNNYVTELPDYVEVLKTPGHSKGSLCFLIDNYLFSGDTIIRKEFLVSKLPGGNKKELQKSIEEIEKLSKKVNDLTIFPGHGDVFKFDIEFLR